MRVPPHYIHFAKHLPGGENLLRLAEALGVSVDYLMWLEFRIDPENPPHGAWVQDNQMTEAIELRMDADQVEITLEQVA